MPTLPTISLSKPHGIDKIPPTILAYFKARFKQHMFNAIVKEYKKSGLNQVELAQRLDRDPAVISRLFAGPGNLTLDTISDVLFASNGAELLCTVVYPLAQKNSLKDYLELKPIAGSQGDFDFAQLSKPSPTKPADDRIIQETFT